MGEGYSDTMLDGGHHLTQGSAVYPSIYYRWMAASLDGCLLVRRNAWDPAETRRAALHKKNCPAPGIHKIQHQIRSRVEISIVFKGSRTRLLWGSGGTHWTGAPASGGSKARLQADRRLL